LLEEALGTATYKRLNILELGCGCGMVGIGLAQAIPDCEVLITDLPEAEEIATRNIKEMNPAMSSSVSFRPLDWDEPLPPGIQSKTFGVIIVAECTYNTDSIPALIHTLERLLKRSPKAIVCLSTKVRHESESMFHDLVKESGILVHAGKTGLPLPREASGAVESVDVYIFHHKNRPSTPGGNAATFWQD